MGAETGEHTTSASTETYPRPVFRPETLHGRRGATAVWKLHASGILDSPGRWPDDERPVMRRDRPQCSPMLHPQHWRASRARWSRGLIERLSSPLPFLTPPSYPHPVAGSTTALSLINRRHSLVSPNLVPIHPIPGLPRSQSSLPHRQAYRLPALHPPKSTQ
jgi:hypothetical protein